MKNSTDHIVLHRQGSLCLHCGKYEELQLPLPIPLVVKAVEVFTKAHRRCKKTWIRPTPNSSMSLNEKIAVWLEWGHTGTSSQTILSVLTDTKVLEANQYSHPIDWADFKRCHLLLEAIPELKDNFHLMKSVSPVWELLVNDWNRLTNILLDDDGDYFRLEPFPFYTSTPSHQ